tara:strand:- start:8229 stop:8396 length:168 start_codon:yes stop_codon:yes gene_type:complete
MKKTPTDLTEFRKLKIARETIKNPSLELLGGPTFLESLQIIAEYEAKQLLKNRSF